MSRWWFHFLHDPMRDNPWSLGAMLLLSALVLTYMWWRVRR
jgi:hypothetical protein